MKPPTPFALLLQHCGLSHRETADFLMTSVDAVKSWSSGRNRRPAFATGKLADLALGIDEEARGWFHMIEDGIDPDNVTPDVIELEIAPDDNEARKHGKPCAAVERAVLARVVAWGMWKGLNFRIVPRL